MNEAPYNIFISSDLVEQDINGAAVGTITGVDPDTGDTLTFSMGTNGDSSSFEIANVNNSAQLKLKDTVTADYDIKSSYSVDVIVTDSGNLSFTKTFTITVSSTRYFYLNNLSINENRPIEVVGELIPTNKIPTAGNIDFHIGGVESFRIQRDGITFQNGTFFNIDATTPTLNFQTSGATRSSILFNDTDDKLVLTNNSNEMIKIYSDKINLLNNKALRFESTDSSYSNINTN